MRVLPENEKRIYRSLPSDQLREKVAAYREEVKHPWYKDFPREAEEMLEAADYIEGILRERGELLC